MGTTELIIGLAGLLFGVLTYFAGVERGQQYRAEDRATRERERAEEARIRCDAEREKRISAVVDRYRDLANRHESSNLKGMVRAGVLSLDSSSEVAEVCERIEREGLTPGIPQSYMKDLHGGSLLRFFQLLVEREDDARSNAGVHRLIEEANSDPAV